MFCKHVVLNDIEVNLLWNLLNLQLIVTLQVAVFASMRYLFSKMQILKYLPLYFMTTP